MHTVQRRPFNDEPAMSSRFLILDRTHRTDWSSISTMTEVMFQISIRSSSRRFHFGKQLSVDYEAA